MQRVKLYKASKGSRGSAQPLRKEPSPFSQHWEEGQIERQGGKGAEIGKRRAIEQNKSARGETDQSKRKERRTESPSHD